MSDEMEEGGEIPAEELKEIDQILEEADPAFVKDLSQISAENLDNKQIGLPTEEEVKKRDKWYYRFWYNLDTTKQKILVIGVFLVFGALPLFLFSISGRLTPEFSFTNFTSLEKISDEVISLNPSAHSKDLMDLFLIDQFFLEIPEQGFVVRPQNDIQVGRFAFYLELASREDTVYFTAHYEEIIEILSRTLKQYGMDDFNGIEGKEEMRKIILASLNGRLEVKIKNIRYKLVVF